MSVLPPPTNERYNTSLALVVLRLIVIIPLLIVFVDASPSNAGGAVLTVKVLLVPVWVPSDVLMETLPPTVLRVTEPVQTPAAKAVVVAGLMVPTEADRVLVLV